MDRPVQVVTLESARRGGPSDCAGPLQAAEFGMGRYVALVDSDNRNSAELVERLVVALQSSGADVAVASPLKKGGKLQETSRFCRYAWLWTNRFLSLAAHGDLLAVAGVTRVFERSTLQRALAACPGVDYDSEVLLESRRQGARILELPATVESECDRELGWWGVLWLETRRAWNRLRTGLHYRPALWLAVPGLFPGLLPLVVAVLLALRATPALSAAIIGATIVVQYASLALFGWQASSFIARLLRVKAAR